MNRPHRAYSLIECLVLITAVSVLLGLSATLLHSLMNFDRADRRRMAAAEMVDRLGRTLRADAHEAIGPAEINPTRLALTLGEGRSVVYLVEPTRLIRTLQRKNKSIHRDVFSLPARVSAKLEGRGDPKALEAVAVILDEKNETVRPAEGPYRNYSIEASLGRDRRYVQESSR